MAKMGLFTSVVMMVGALALGGCASGATAQGMTVRSGDVKPAPEEIAHSIAVEDVTGGKETNPAWKSEVSSSDFKAALLASMKTAGLLSDATAARYKVRAVLLGLRQPYFTLGFDMKVTATVRYVVTDAKTGATLLDETIETPHTAGLGDAAIGTMRLRLANEGAARKNIKGFIEKVNEKKLNERPSKQEPATTASR